MKALGISTLPLTLALLAGCGGSQTVPKHITPSAMVHQSGKSWMLPQASGEDLLYLTSQEDFSLYVYSYPGLNQVGQISFDAAPFGLCSDANGNVFVTTGSIASSNVYEYAHGGTQPIAALSDPGSGNSCAVDPVTGNLAVTNSSGHLGSFNHGNVAVYQHAQGDPSVYYYSNIFWYFWCTFDASGNLFVDGDNEGNGPPAMAELPKDGSELQGINLSNDAIPENLAWHNGHLLIFVSTKPRGPKHIYKTDVSGSTATVVGKTSLRNTQWGLSQFILQDKTIIGPGERYSLGFWPYPKGGSRTHTMKGRRGYPWLGVTVSLAPSRSRTRH